MGQSVRKNKGPNELSPEEEPIYLQLGPTLPEIDKRRETGSLSVRRNDSSSNETLPSSSSISSCYLTTKPYPSRSYINVPYYMPGNPELPPRKKQEPKGIRTTKLNEQGRNYINPSKSLCHPSFVPSSNRLKTQQCIVRHDSRSSENAVSFRTEVSAKTKHIQTCKGSNVSNALCQTRFQNVSDTMPKFKQIQSTSQNDYDEIWNSAHTTTNASAKVKPLTMQKDKNTVVKNTDKPVESCMSNVTSVHNSNISGALPLDNTAIELPITRNMRHKTWPSVATENASPVATDCKCPPLHNYKKTQLHAVSPPNQIQEGLTRLTQQRNTAVLEQRQEPCFYDLSHLHAGLKIYTQPSSLTKPSDLLVLKSGNDDDFPKCRDVCFLSDVFHFRPQDPSLASIVLISLPMDQTDKRYKNVKVMFHENTKLNNPHTWHNMDSTSKTPMGPSCSTQGSTCFVKMQRACSFVIVAEKETKISCRSSKYDIHLDAKYDRVDRVLEVEVSVTKSCTKEIHHNNEHLSVELHLPKEYRCFDRPRQCIPFELVTSAGETKSAPNIRWNAHRVHVPDMELLEIICHLWQPNGGQPIYLRKIISPEQLCRRSELSQLPSCLQKLSVPDFIKLVGILTEQHAAEQTEVSRKPSISAESRISHPEQAKCTKTMEEKHSEPIVRPKVYTNTPRGKGSPNLNSEYVTVSIENDVENDLEYQLPTLIPHIRERYYASNIAPQKFIEELTLSMSGLSTTQWIELFKIMSFHENEMFPDFMQNTAKEKCELLIFLNSSPDLKKETSWQLIKDALNNINAQEAISVFEKWFPEQLYV